MPNRRGGNAGDEDDIPGFESALYGVYRSEIDVMKVLLHKIEAALWGNGQPGIIQKHEDRITALEKNMWLAVGALGILQFLTGSGIISLSKLIGAGKP